MKFPDLAPATDGDARLLRAAAITFIGAIVIATLHVGRDVLIPAAIAVLFAFILAPAVTWVRRLLPLPFAVAAAGLLAGLVMAHLAEVAGSLTSYQTNLQLKIKDIRGLSEGGGAVSRF